MRRRVMGVVAVACLFTCAPAWGHGTPSDRQETLTRAARHGSASFRPSLVLVKGSASSRESSTVRNGRLASALKPRPKARFTLTPATLTYLGGRAVLSFASSHADRCTLGTSPRFFSGPNPQRVKCHGSYSLTLPALTFPARWTFTLRAKGSTGKPAVVRRTLSVQGAPFQLSTNWSGYVVPSATPFTAVSGRFTVPRLDCHKTKNAGESVWVGTGGAGSSAGDLLQTGVRSDCDGGMQVDDPGWWELWPPLPEEDFKTLSVAPGDAIQATVMQNLDKSWTTRLDDLTTGFSGVMTTGTGYGTVSDSNPTTWLHEEGPTASLTYAGGTSAEWIVEDFESASTLQLVPLADFETVTFTGLTTNLPSWALTSSEQVGMGSGPLLLSVPSPADASGRGFSVTFTGPKEP
jgi:Peptidase A4 family